MSSVAVLTQESFAEHRSGLIPQQLKVTTLNSEEESDPPTYKDAFPPLPEKAACLENAQEPAGAWSNKIRPIKASVITQVFHVPLEERKYKDMNQFGEGEQAKICLEIMQRTGAHLELSLAKDQGLSIMVSGKLDAVMKARKDIVARLQTQASATVPIPKEHHRFVIGKNGEKLQDLELKTATKIQIPRPDDPSNQIKITGTKEGIEKARHEVLLISAEQDKRAVERLEVEKAFHPFIAGPYNRLVGEIMQETGTRINIPPPSVNRTEIVFTGEKEQLAQAVARIKKIYEEKKKKTTTIAVEVKKSQHKYVIGPKGNSLQEILERTGVSVEIPPSDSVSETVILRGEPEKLGQALTEVYAKANSFTVSSVSAPSWLHRFIIGKKGQNLAKITQQMPKANIAEVEVSIPAKLHNSLIGTKGRLIRSIMEECGGVHIHFPVEGSGSDTVVIRGPSSDVEKAKKQLLHLAEEKINRMDYVEINIDHKFHRHLIGKNGANINRIKDQYKVSVRIPPDSEKSNLIRIEGDPQGVQQAKRELLELASRMENERTKDLIIEQRFHRTIIGQKGERIREIRDKFPEVIINFPDPAQKSDVVQLRGPKNEVEKCTKYMQKMVADLVENSYSISVPIFKQFHKNIIGKGGANIKKIREESNTKIDLPAENSNSETIVITGKRANCEAARSRILSIQKDLVMMDSLDHFLCYKIVGPFVPAMQGLWAGMGSYKPAPVSTGIQKALQELLLRSAFLAEPFAAVALQTKSFTVDIRAKPEYHKFLIGKGGGKIRKVRDSTGARIIFPVAEDKDQDLITIVGKEDAVREAQKELEALIQNLDNVVEDYMLVEPKHHRHFVIRRGQVLREIAEEYGGVMVSFPRSGTQSDKVTLKGAKDCVEAAKKRIQEIIEDLEAQVTVECAIPQKFHRSVMGPKGSRIQQITRDYNVQIKFPDREENPGQSAEQAIQENGDEAGEGREADPGSPRRCDIIIISGRKEKCEAAKEALEALVPVTIEVEVPFDLHRYIIGQKGSGIRKMMDEFEVNIHVPAPELQSDIIAITGLAANLGRAKAGLLERVKELQAEQEDRALRSFKLSVTVDPKYHPKIIGRKGAVITQIRLEHDVNIQFPDKDDGSQAQDQITITGYEKNTEAARDAILKIVGELEQMVSEDVPLDHRVHARIIGARGKAIRKIMDEFKVDIRFPQSGAPDPNCVTVTGLPENVEEAIDHILNLEEEYLADVVDSEALQVYMKPPAHEEYKAPSKGFVVRDAPWTASSSEKAPDMSSSEEFPSFGAQVAPKTLPWGPKR
ncbi:PREDICTED: vigilin [Dipodomys ordii]|uniref:Vigilin n=1 Tax=Dipodomys ordii TaxID=10020 RepID=A0A1S3GJX8_DIPOR|nr:PREDICTED: vigilin [Dipodomys ordii]